MRNSFAKTLERL